MEQAARASTDSREPDAIEHPQPQLSRASAGALAPAGTARSRNTRTMSRTKSTRQVATTSRRSDALLLASDQAEAAKLRARHPDAVIVITGVPRGERDPTSRTIPAGPLGAVGYRGYPRGFVSRFRD
jgi:hypothetical protein